jgi:hypothetical protein
METQKPLAVVTGASSGIGEALARRIAADGHPLVLVARRQERLDSLAAELPVETQTVALDLTEPAAGDRLEEALAALGRAPGILVNNAGFGELSAFAETERSKQVSMVDLNVRAVVDLTHRFLPGMLENGRGGVLNVSSTAAFQPGPGMAIYYASKSFVLSFSEALSEEVRGSGVKVTALCPGPTATEFGAISGMAKSRIFRAAHRVSMSAEDVADHGWRGFLSGRRVVIPGLANKTTAAGSRFVPHALLLPFVKRLQRTD